MFNESSGIFSILWLNGCSLCVCLRPRASLNLRSWTLYIERWKHWAIILLEEVLLSLVSQKSVAKNMADFHVCLRHLVPFGNGIYHWQTAILCFWRCLSPLWIFDKKCFSFRAKIFFCYFACFTKSRKKCLSYPLVDATIRYKRRVFSSGKMYFLETFQMAKKFVCMKFCFCFKLRLLCFYLGFYCQFKQ